MFSPQLYVKVNSSSTLQMMMMMTLNTFTAVAPFFDLLSNKKREPVVVCIF